MERANSCRWTAWLAVVLVHWCLCVRERNKVAVEASHVVYESLQSVPASVVDSKLRTGYHFQPPKHWINGTLLQPQRLRVGQHRVAHSVSTDLINWVALEPAIYPSKPFDIKGCWSGSATILPGNKPLILYTGLDPRERQVQNIAYPKNLSDPYLREWVKPDFNPVIAPDDGVNASAFRDPTTAWRGPGGHWKLVAKHSLHSARDTGMWECPDFYPVALKGTRGLDTSVYGHGVKYVLKVSLDITRYEYYTVGKYYHDKDKYVPDATSADDHTGLRYDYGNFYASKTFFDGKKQRRILWGWANESDTSEVDKAKGWAGIQTIPRTILLDGSGRQLVQWPIEEIESVRGKHVVVEHKRIPSGGFFEVNGIDSSQADVEVSFDVSGLEKAEDFHPSWATDAEALCGRKTADVKGGVGPFGLLVLASANMEEKTAVFFRVFKADHKHVVLMCHDPTRSSLRAGLYKPTFAGFVDVDIAKTGKISLRSLIDNSVVESFGAKGKTCITSRVYPSLAIGEDAHLFIFNNGSTDVKVSELNAWEMKKPLMNGA
ncbi:Cell wall invertase [Musa troglodytarum]|uniref:Cell wall invertase n=1 Tax=Musa troglodytarum TaxID=320322 RepID=A0A9E7KEB8_9LILI|nr:Cell wall invertase [Musa troglodytarum]